ncbi:hypothetical protein GGR53DRAFT_531365 [Hypoxylon sp. FL1150]|nr:hypothetical protein GGR53DRAFT_531365 [Hypoxylon sp. FL1150]
MTPVDTSARYIPLQGLSLAIVVVSSIFLILSVLAVSGRTYIRYSERVFGLDDGLMLFGTIVYIAAVALSSYAAFVGLGSHDDKLNAFFSEEGKKYFTIWILVYVHALATIKSSICITILRIAGTRRVMRISVWVLLAITWASYLVTFIGDMLVCRPIEASWKPELVLSGEAYCAPMELMIALSHTATGSTVATDLACAVLPGIILWNTQMNKRSKISAYVLLSFASTASIVTIIRAFYITHYNTPLDNLLFWVGHIALLSNIEIGIGCIASSVPTLRRLFVRKGDSSQVSSRKPWDRRGSKSLITFGSLPNHGRGSGSRSKFRNPTDTGFSLATVHAQGDWERLQDGDSDKNLESGGSLGKNGIRADYTYTVELSQSSKKGKSFYLSGEGV